MLTKKIVSEPLDPTVAEGRHAWPCSRCVPSSLPAGIP